jgi:hypothetical protein
MQEAQKPNVVQISDFAHRRGSATRIDRPAAGFSVASQRDLFVFPRLHAPYPGGIDDLQV